MKDLTGQAYARATVIEFCGRNKQYNSLWLCRCQCGREFVAVGSNLVRGTTKSCGCYKSEATVRAKTKHGHRRKSKTTAEYRAWAHAKGRCENVRDKQYVDYGGRGIRMCLRWRESFDAFIEDMGEKPSPTHSLDRTNNEGSYSCGKCDECIASGWPENCRWSTPKEQANNRRVKKKRYAAVTAESDDRPSG